MPHSCNSLSDVDWLISSKPQYGETQFANWPQRESSDPLQKFAKLKRAYPTYLDKASDYLFAASGAAFEQMTRDIPKAEIENRQIDRRASLLGGFPWTDHQHQWPHFIDDEGQITWHYPVVQLNLRDLAPKLDIELPPILLQVWDGLEVLREIPLASTETIPWYDEADDEPPPPEITEPSWWFPNYREVASSFGWDSDDEDVVGKYIEVGERHFKLANLHWALGANATYIDEYHYQAEDDQWKDAFEWQALRELPEPDRDTFDALGQEAQDAFDVAEEGYAFLGAPYELGGDPYAVWTKDGYRALYTAQHSPGAGLNLWNGGYLTIFYRKNEDGTFDFKLHTGEI